MSAITNIDNDHLDYYKTEENIKKAFVEFSNKIPFYGYIAINANDKNSCELLENLRRPHITYGVEKLDSYVESIDYLAIDIVHSEDKSTFTLKYNEKTFTVEISLSGDHNVQNALAAISISHQVGLDLKEVCDAIKTFDGVGRRFENLYRKDDFIVIDDYGHHPTELNATIDTAKAKFPNHKLITIFEPHRYSRTKEHWHEFIECFEGVDEIYISPIYAASETPIEYIDSEILVKNINDKFGNAHYFDDWNKLKEIFEQNKDDKVVVLSMGAGSISKTTRNQIEEWKN